MFNKYSFLQIIIIAFKQIVESLRIRVLPYASYIYCSQGKHGHTCMSVAGMHEYRGGYRSESGSKACPKSLGSEHRAGPSSVRLCSSYSVSLCPGSLSPGLVVFRDQDGGWGHWKRGWEGQACSAPLAGHGRYVPLPPLPSRCQSDSAMPCAEPVGRRRVQSVGCVRPQRPKGEVERSRGSYLVGSEGQRSQGDRGSGCPGRYPHADRAHGAGRGSPRAHRGLLWAREEASGHGLERPLTTPHPSLPAPGRAPSPLKPSRHRHWNSYSPAGMHVAPLRQGWRSHGELS